MPKRTVMVFVFGEPHPVTVEQKSKSVWVAVGEYKGSQSKSKIKARARRWLDGARRQNTRLTNAPCCQLRGKIIRLPGGGAALEARSGGPDL